MSDEPVENIDGYRVAVDEMKYAINRQSEGLQISKATARQVLSSASLVVGLIGALQIFVTPPASWMVLYYVLIGIACLLYVAMIAGCLWVLGMVTVSTSIVADWEDIYNYYILATDQRDLLRKQLSNCLSIIEDNRVVVNSRAKMANWLVGALGAVVFILVLIAVFARL